ncbi:Ester hydrolase C11orf54 [Nymphon striatum]|nr:Ester hydrolase C11orf54 [Nymphon striatum]
MLEWHLSEAELSGPFDLYASPRSVLHKGLSENFKDVVVEVVDCPDLSKEPFHLAAEGLCGSTRLVDIGGPPYLVPSPKRDKVYNLPEISKLIELPGAFMLGAGAGPCHYVGTNCEMMPNIKVGTNANEEVNNSYIAKVDEQNNSYILKKLDGCKDMCLLANLFACEGKRDKVLKIRAKRRIGEQNFVTCMRKCLNKQFGDKPIGLGGAFVIVNGKAKLHVMKVIMIIMNANRN